MMTMPLLRWRQRVAEILHDELEWNDREASTSCDAMEAGKYRHEGEKIAIVLRALLDVQTRSRPASPEEREILFGDFRPASKHTQRTLSACRESMIKDQPIHTINPQT